MSQSLRCCFVLACLLGLVLMFPQPVRAATEDDIQQLKQNMVRQEELINSMKQTLAAQQDRLVAQERELNTYQAKLDTLGKLSDVTMTKIRGAGASPNPSPASDVSASTPISSPAEPEKEQRPQINVLPDAGGVLTPKGTLMYENSLEYTNTSNNVFSFDGVQVAQAVLVGIINATTTRQQTVMDSSRLRFGVTNRLEADVRIPYVHANSTGSVTDTSTDTTTRTSINGDGLGDIDAGLAYQINRGQGGWPYFVGNLRYKSNTGDGPYDVPVDTNNVITKMPTGTGFNAAQASLTAIKVTDPAVLFANLGYIYNIPESVNRTFNNTRILDVKGGDNINASAGMAFSINPDMSFTLGYKHTYVFPVIQTARTVDSGVNYKSRTDTLQVGALLFGMSYRLSSYASLNFSAEVGATSDAPDVHLGLRIPFRLGELY